MGAQTPTANQCPRHINEQIPDKLLGLKKRAFKLDQMGNQQSNIIRLKLISKNFLSHSLAIPLPAPD